MVRLKLFQTFGQNCNLFSCWRVYDLLRCCVCANWRSNALLMIDYLVTNWTYYFLSATQLIPANVIRFTKRSWMAFVATVGMSVRQTGRIDVRNHFTKESRLPLFCPNCYPFRNADKVTCLLICAL